MLKWGPPRVLRHRKLSMNLGPSLVRGSGGRAWGLPAPWEGVVHAGTHQAEGTYSGLQTWGNVWSSWVIREGDVLKKCSVISSVLQEWKPRSRMVWSWHLLWLLDEGGFPPVWSEHQRKEASQVRPLRWIRVENKHFNTVFVQGNVLLAKSPSQHPWRRHLMVIYLVTGKGG